MSDETPPYGIPRPDILMADLARIRDMLHAGIADDELDGLAATWLRLDTARIELETVCRDLCLKVGSMLADADYDPKQGYRLPNGEVVSHYQPSAKERWQGRRLLRDLSTPMVDPATGELHDVVPFSILTQIVPGTASDELTSSKWGTTGLKNLDVDPNQYRSREFAEPRVKKGAGR